MRKENYKGIIFWHRYLNSKYVNELTLKRTRQTNYVINFVILKFVIYKLFLWNIRHW